MMEQQPPLPVVEAGISQPRQRRSPTRPPSFRRHLLLRLVPAVPLGDGSPGWTRQIVYARDLRTGDIRRVAVLRSAYADGPHEPPDDHEPPGAAARQQAGPSTSVDWPLREAA